MNAVCPECEASIKIDNPMRGDIINCPDCAADLEVTSINPLTLELAPMTEEDLRRVTVISNCPLHQREGKD